MDFHCPLPSNTLSLWNGMTTSEDKSIGNMMDLNDYFVAQPTPIQDPPTATQDLFPFYPNTMDQYLPPSSIVSDGLFSTQEMELLDPIQQYLTLSPTESYHTLPDFITPSYDSQGYSELSFALGGPSAPIPTSSLNQNHDHYRQYTMPTIPFPKPLRNSELIPMGWPGEDSVGVSLTHISPPSPSPPPLPPSLLQAPIQQGITPTLKICVSPVQERTVNYVSPHKPSVPQGTTQPANVQYGQAVGRKGESYQGNIANNSHHSIDVEWFSRREALGLRNLQRGTDTTTRPGGVEVFISSSPKREERYFDGYGSDGVSNGNSDDDQSAYHPSPASSSPSNDQCSPFSYNPDNSATRGSSKSTLDEEYPGVSPSGDGEGYKRTTGSRRKSKGKAKGSAALALAKLTMKNNKPLTGPFGTFVPYPRELSEGPGAIACSGDGTTAGVRIGRKRRNGHIPPPILVPDLVKRSRGRKVPSSRPQVGMQGEAARPFVCEVERCGASFTRREHLKRHSRSLHTNEKEYICPEPSCGKSFNRRDNLAQHSRIHLTEADPGALQGPADSDGSPRVGSP